MKKITLGLTAVATATLLASPAFAALKVGDKAPGFSIPVATNGVVSTFSLQDALKSGPVVVYFYPKAFTGGCSLEAHQFSEAIPKFEAKHVTVVGVSTDEIGTLQKFSKEVCQGKFPVGADTKAVVTKAYDAQMGTMNMSNRISYVVGTDGKIAFVHDSGDASTHVSTLLQAVDAGK
ncbi:MAG: redoxin domain-containing protein [Asticcacaulis sp.]|nr:redoxin domain-containing protein [Asticcacaulis sp.]